MGLLKFIVNNSAVYSTNCIGGVIVADNDRKAIEEEQKAKASTRAKNKYNASHYDSLRIVVPKGDKERIRAFADSRGQTINGFVNCLIKKEMGEE